MRGALAVLRLEAARWRGLLLVAPLAGSFALLARVPRIGGPFGAEVTDGTALVLGLALAVLGVAWGGAGRLGAPAERAFFLAHGLPAGAVWAGQLAAAWLGSLAVLLLALVPATLVGGGLLGEGIAELLAWPMDELGEALVRAVPAWAESGEWLPWAWLDRWSAWAPGPQLLLLSLLLLALTCLAALLGTLLRARDAATLLDLFALAATIAGFAWGTRGLLAQRAAGEAMLCGAILALALLLGGLLGSFLAIALGRCDAARSHRGWSLGLWGAALLGTFAAGGRARWALDVELGDLEEIEVVEHAPAGGWAVVLGRARGRVGYQVLGAADLSAGALHPVVGLGAMTDLNLCFSRDGRWLGWTVPDERAGGNRLSLLDLTDPRAEPVRLPGLFTTGTWIVAVSPGGAVVVQERGRVRVLALPVGRPVAQEPPVTVDSSLVGATFPEPGTVRLLRAIRGPDRIVDGHSRWSADRLTVLDLFLADGGARTARELRFGGDLPGLYQRFDPQGARILAVRRDPPAVFLAAAEGGEEPRQLQLPAELRGLFWTLFLDGGGVAVAWSADPVPGTVGRRALLALFGPDGAPTDEPFDLGLPPGRGLMILAQPDGGSLVACWRTDWREGSACTLVDLAGRDVTPLGDGLEPVALTSFFAHRGPPLPVGEPATRLFTDRNGRLLWLDLETRALVPFTPPG